MLNHSEANVLPIHIGIMFNHSEANVKCQNHSDIYSRNKQSEPSRVSLRDKQSVFLRHTYSH
ncbi:hypothetical protein Hanom_Chr16g01440221 [Helianthus anomalus]